MENKDYINIFKALGEETRLQIFQMILNGPLCACKIQEKFSLTQPTLSHHLKVLSDSKIIKAKKNGKWIFYSVNCEMLDQVIGFVSAAKCVRENNFKQ